MKLGQFLDSIPLINEVKSSIPLTWTKTSNKWISTFEIGEDKIKIEIVDEISCLDNSELVTSFNFYRWVDKKWIIDQIPSENSMKILASMFKAADEYIREKHPGVIVFLGDRKETSRVKLYTRLLKMLKKYGYVETKEYIYNDNVVYIGTVFEDITTHPCINQIVDALSKFDV